MKKVFVFLITLVICTHIYANENNQTNDEPRVNKFAKKIVIMYENAQLPYQIDKHNMLLSVESKANLIEFTIKNNKKNIEYIKVKNKVCKRLINFLNLGGEIKYHYKDSHKVYETYEFDKKSCK